MIKEELLDNLPENPFKAAKYICDIFRQFDDSLGKEEKDKNYDDYIELLGIFMAYCDAHGIPYDVPALTADKSLNIQRIRSFFHNYNLELDIKITHVLLKSSHERYQLKFGSGFIYEFTDGDLKRIQTLINELRDLINKSELFDADHKSRILKRLEDLQAELHKKSHHLISYGVSSERRV